MIPDAITYAKRCHACQVHGDFIHQAPGYLRSATSTWPFDMWGMDVVGPISPPSSKGHRFILAITDYFSKWAEAIPLREVMHLTWSNSLNIMSFTALVYHDGLCMIIGPSSSARLFRGSATSLESRMCPQRHTIQPLMTLQKLSTRLLENSSRNSSRKSQRDWDDKLGECLWPYRTTIRTPTKATPFSLEYGCEAVLPLEI